MLVEQNVNLAQYHTFHTQVEARYVVTCATLNELRSVYSDRRFEVLEKTLLGGGSNVLFSGDYAGVLIRPKMMGIEEMERTAKEVVLRVGAGEEWDVLVAYSVQQGFGGLENLTLIPGWVGAAPMQNIGAYGVEVRQTIEKVETLDLKTMEVQTFTNAECGFGYRHSIFKEAEHKGRYAITYVWFRLALVPVLNTRYAALTEQLTAWEVASPTLLQVREAVAAVRRSKLPDPAVLGNAGSFFKNPEVAQEKAEELLAQFDDMPQYPGQGGKVKLAGGYLIEKAGFKGLREGDAGIHAKQALVLVNYGNAPTASILALARRVQAAVMGMFGVPLEMEVNVIEGN
jgi:UDP-N-acetylmuramate dehydrogenase